jgi:amidase
MIASATSGLLLTLCGVPALTAQAATSPATPTLSGAAARAASARTGVDVVDLGIADLGTMLATGATTSEELVGRYLQRIEAYDKPYADQPGLGAIISLNPNALTIARELDAERAAGSTRGPLHGVPVLVKDNIATDDLPTSAGNGELINYRTAADATVVQRLRDAGAIILAKSNLAEFALTGDDTVSFFGRTNNPYNQQLDVSGSSGGNAAGVAASFAAAAIGTDTAGSIIGPSTNGALVGLRPTFGLTSQTGVVPGNLMADVVGPMAKTVEDAALLLDVIAGHDGTDPNSAGTAAVDASGYAAGLSDTSLRGARIGVPASWEDYTAGPGAIFTYLTPDQKATYDQAILDLTARGAIIVPVQYTTATFSQQVAALDLEYQLQQYFLSTPAEVPAEVAALAAPVEVFDLNDVLAGQKTSLGELFAELTPSDTPNPDYLAAVAAVPSEREEFAGFFAAAGIDALVLPSIVSAEKMSVDGSTELTTRFGAPGVTVPSGYDAETGRPLGIKFIGQRFDDGKLLSFAYDYEQATGHRIEPTSVPELPQQAAAVGTASPFTIAGVVIGSTIVIGAIAAVTVVVVRRKAKRA